MTRIPELWGVREVAAAAGVTPQAVSNWAARHRDFPEPLARLAQGPVWAADDVRVWLRATGRAP